MKKQPEIILLTGDVQSGKSNALWQFALLHRRIGFVTPTIFGKKKFKSLQENFFRAYQLDEENDYCYKIGRYFLCRKAFDVAEKIGMESLKNPDKWFVLDEIGKLELLNKGHHKLAENLLRLYPHNMLWVVRENLLNDVIQKYQLQSTHHLTIQKVDDLSCEYQFIETI